MADELPSSTEPRDASPLALEQLSDQELATILLIERRLYEAQPGEGPVHDASPEPYFPPVEVRYPRVLLLDGGRGTGKTSLLLTLAHRWHPRTECGVAAHDSAPDAYRARVEDLRRQGTMSQGKWDFDIPRHVRVVGRILDFDPLPAGMPLVAAIVNAWWGLADHFDKRLSGRHSRWAETHETLLDKWQRLFRAAITGRVALPGGRGLVEHVLDWQEQVADWQAVDKMWRDFVDEVIKIGTQLSSSEWGERGEKPLFAIMVDDVDLQVRRIRELLPTLRLLYHRSVVFLIAADRRHLVDMLKLDFYGQQRFLGGPAADSYPFPNEVLYHGARTAEQWARKLANATVEKVFPLRNCWQVHQLHLYELLRFPTGADEKSEGAAMEGRTLRSILNAWPAQGHGPLGDFLASMAGSSDDPVELPPIMPYRAAHQIYEHASAQHGDAASATEALRGILGGLDSRETVTERSRVQGSTLEYALVGQLAALFRQELAEAISPEAEIVVSSRFDLAYTQSASSDEILHRIGDRDTDVINFASAVVALTLQDEGYGVFAPGLKWDVRLGLAWTRARVFHGTPRIDGLEAAFQWPLQRRPSPMALLRWTKQWGDFLRELHVVTERRIARIAYGWLYYQLHWLDAPMAGVPDPLEWNEELAWGKLLDADRWPEDGTGPDRERWRGQTLPLLTRPEIGLEPELQRLLLGPDTKANLSRLREQRRRLVLEAVRTSLDEREVRGMDRHLNLGPDVLERAMEEFEANYLKTYGESSQWRMVVELPVRAD